MSEGRFLVEMTHRKTGEKRWMGTVPLDPEERAICEEDGETEEEIRKYENEIFLVLDEAKVHCYQDEQSALDALLAVEFQSTENIEAELIEVGIAELVN